MKGDEALRQRRSRRHRRGDHSLCIASRCAALAVPPGRELDDRSPVDVEESVLAFARTLPLQPGDPRSPLCAAAVVLAREVDRRGPSLPGLARELRILISHMGEIEKESNTLDEIRARRAQRVVNQILDAVS